MKFIDPKYINMDGFVTIQPNANPSPGEGNGWLQTGLAFVCGWYPFDIVIVDRMFARCVESPTTPLIWRSPYKKFPGDETKCDDYWGAPLLSLDWANRVISFTNKNGWSFPIGGLKWPGSWFGRFPSFAPFMRACSSADPKPFDSFRMAMVILFNSTQISRADINMQTYCQITAARIKNFTICAWAAKIWKSRVRKKYGTIGNSWAAYFGPGHPLNDFEEEKFASA